MAHIKKQEKIKTAKPGKQTGDPVKNKAATLKELVDGFDADKLNNTALIMRSIDSAVPMSYGALQETVRAVGNALLGMGIKKGDRVGLLAENRIEWVVAYCASASIGAVIVPIDIFMEAEEIKLVMNAGKIKMLFTSAFFMEKVSGIKKSVPSLKKILSFDEHKLVFEEAGNAKENGASYELYETLVLTGKELLEKKADKYSKVILEPEDAIAMIYVRGKKFAVLSHRGLMANIHAISERLSESGKYLREGDTWLTNLPFHHAYPVMIGFLVALSCSNKAVIVALPKVQDFVTIIRETEANYLFTVPLYMELLCKEGKKRPLGIDSVKFIISGGAPLGRTIIDGMKEQGIPYLQGYGLTEYSPVVSTNSISLNSPGSIGKALPGVLAKIENPDEQGDGELLIKGPGVMKEYYRMPKDTEAVIDAHGWLRTGDIARIDEEGYIYITGRLKKIIINKGGKNIFPEDIEKLLKSSSYIADARVVPRLDAKMGEYPHAFLYPDFDAVSVLEKKEKKRMSDEDLRELMVSEIQKATTGWAKYKIPGGFDITYTKISKLEDEPERFMFESFYAAAVPEEDRDQHTNINKHVDIHVREDSSAQKDGLYRRQIEAFLAALSAEVLSLSVADIDARENFLDFLDSVQVVAIAEKIDAEISIELHPTILFEYTNIRSLAGYLSREYHDLLRNYFGEADPDTANNMVSNDEDAAGNTGSRHTGGNDRSEQEVIAVIGAGCRFPQSETPEDFLKNLEQGKDLVSEVPADRWDWKQFYGDPLEESNKTKVKWGGFIEDADKFDAAFFGITPREAGTMDPQQRIFLETVWKTIEDAGYKASELSGKKVGVFAGVSTLDYHELLGASDLEADGYAAIGTAHAIVANRVSYLLNLHGPSEPVNTACSSSLIAAHRAVENIRSGACDMALAGGVNLIFNPRLHISFSKAGMLSEDGRCKTFDAGANGYVRGEGAGVILLKPLREAEKDGDNIYAIIKGSSVNHGGYSNTITAPNPNAQAQLIINAYEGAGVEPETVSYIEAHGTGTSLGDPVEINGLKKAFNELEKGSGGRTRNGAYCGLGSVKTNIGHLEAAAGIAGLIKLLLAMKRKTLPASINFTSLNPYIELEKSPFYIVTETGPWESPLDDTGREFPRRAGVSSFGFGGANAHVILEEYREPESSDRAMVPGKRLMLLSARNNDRLREYTREMAAFLKNGGSRLSIDDVAYTLQSGRESMDSRLAVVVESTRDFADKLEKYADTGHSGEDFYSGTVKTNGKAIGNEPEDEPWRENFYSYLKKDDSVGLAGLWVSGANPDWNLLYSGDTPNRVSLPTYPFERKSYWFDSHQSRRKAEAKPIEINVPEPVTNQHLSKESNNRPSTIVLKKKNGPVSKASSYEEVTKKIQLKNIGTSGNTDQGETMIQPHSDAAQKDASVPGMPLNDIKQKVISLLGDVLFLDETELAAIDAHKPFTDLGIDSIIGVELLKLVNTAFGISMKATKLYDYSSVDALSRHIAELCSGPGHPSFSEVPDTKIPKAPAQTYNTDQYKNTIKELLADILYMEPQEIDEKKTFQDLGLDSILGVELLKKLNTSFGISIKATKLYDYSSVEALAAFVASTAETKTDHNEENTLSPEKKPAFHDGEYIPQEPEPRMATPRCNTGCISTGVNEGNTLRHAHQHDTSANPPHEDIQTPNKHMDIAVIGMSCRYPGAENTREYWQNLRNGVDSVSLIPEERWDINRYFDPDPKKPNKSYSKWGGFIENADCFDPRFFNISPADAEVMDPQQRLFLQESWRALEDAGYSIESLHDSRCGVFAGVMNNDYQSMLAAGSGGEKPAQQMMGNSNSILAARIAYSLNLKGPAIAFDTACSSSLVAVHTACRTLLEEEADMMLAGGVTLYLYEEPYIMMSKAGMLSPTGRCRTFDNAADGFVCGEGVGVVVLKRLADAIANGDHVYGVIKGSGLNQDGKTNGITAPSAESQKTLELDVYSKFDINPETISYIETHGTGTKLGDPIEIDALTGSFEAFTQKRNFCALGSVKSNIGHTSAAAGVAGLIKVLLSMESREIVPSLHYRQENEHINFRESPFYVNTTLEPWQSGPGVPLRAAVSAFGFSGTNCHMLIEEAPARSGKEYAAAAKSMSPRYCIPLSAKTETALPEMLAALKTRVRESNYSAQDIGYTLAAGRSSFPVRAAFVVRDREDLLRQLDQVLETGSAPCYRRGTGKKNLLYKREHDERVKTLFRELAEDSKQAGDRDREYAYENKLMELTGLFVEGYDCSIETLYAGTNSRRVSLPGYPFAREQYWIHSGDTLNEENGKFSGLHPLIDKNISTIQEQKFTTRFSGEEFFLKDHQVMGRTVMPGAACMEMARAAGELAGVGTITSLKNISWPQPLFIDAASGEVTVSLYPERSGVEFEICSGTMPHATGLLLSHEPGSMEKIDMAAVQSRCFSVLDKTRCYDIFNSLGLGYGPSFRGIRELRHNEKEVFASLELTGEMREETGGLVLHPGLLDSALQSILGLLYTGDAASQGLFLPVAIDELTIYKAIPAACYAYASFAEETRPGQAVTRFNLSLLDETGTVIVSIKKFAVQGLNSAQPAASSAPERIKKKPVQQTLYLSSEWKEAEAAPAGAAEPGRILLFDSGDSLQRSLQERTGSEVILVSPGEEFSREESYMKLIASLKEQQQVPATIIYNGSGAPEQGVYSLFFLTRAWMKQSAKNPLRLFYCYSGSQKGNRPFHAAMSAFAGSVALENPKVKITALELEPAGGNGSSKTSAAAVNILLREMAYPTAARAVRYSQGTRYVKELFEATPDRDARETIPRKKPGQKPGQKPVYLITGGTGKLGMLFAKYLAQKEAANLVLTDLFNLSPEKEEQVRELEELGAEVLFVKADISGRDDAQALIAAAKKRFSSVNGIIHSAGVIKDSFIVKKTAEDMKSVLAPKVYGTIYLDEALQDENLDFFVLFSSVAAVQGNMGQCDYAYANSFMDNYSAMREELRAAGKRRGKTISINWPLWREGGMHIDEQSEKLVARTMGMLPIETPEGEQAFESARNFRGSHFAVFYGNREKMMRKLGLQTGSTPENSRAGENAESPAGKEVPVNEVRTFTVDRVAEILKVSPSEIDTGEDVREYGFDSISLTELANALNEHYGLAITPALFFEHPTLDSFVAKLCEEYREELGPQADVVENDGSAVKKIQQFLLEKVSALLKVAPSEIDTSEDVREYGFDSISLTELANTINEHYGLAITPALFFEHPTLDSFIENLHGEYRDEFARFYGEEISRTPAPGNAPEVKPAVVRSRKPSRERTRFSAPVSAQHTNEPVAIVGMSGRMPQSPDVETFRQHLEEGRDCVGEVPAERWDWRAYESLPDSEGINVRWGGFVSGVDMFDPLFFGISPREAELMDPQQRLLLETVWNTIEDAGYRASSLWGSNTGLFVGVATSDYNNLIIEQGIEVDPHTATGISHSILTNRVSYILNLHGPSEPVDTACSSSLVAVNHAVDAIQNGRCHMAIAGGINVIVSPRLNLAFSRAGMLSPDGRCKTFDSSANGYVRGEGTGAILLKPLRKAEEDGDHIYGIIKGSAVNHGGRANSLTAPNPNAQAALLVAAYENAGIDPSTVSYIEAHGTGTSLGDPIEINALKKAFTELYNKWGLPAPEAPHCGLGSVKTNIGHLETAAGIAGIIKVLLAMKYRTLPPGIHFEKMNPYISLENSPFYIVDTCSSWEPQVDETGHAVPLRAGVSSFGFGGVNAHVIIEEVSSLKLDASAPLSTGVGSSGEGEQVVVLSARDGERLDAYVRKVRDFLVERRERGETLSLADAAYTLQVGRESMEERLAMVVSSVDELIEKMERCLDGDDKNESVFRGNSVENKELINLLTNGDVGVDVIRILSKTGEPLRLAQLWATGVAIEWDLVHEDRDARRVSLPTYPFAREQYWITGDGARDMGRQDDVCLHPLVGRNTSGFSGFSFRTRLTGAEFFLADHIVLEQKILPAVAYIEMARAAGEIAAGKKVFSIRDISFSMPLGVNNEPVEAAITLNSFDGGNGAHYEVSTTIQNRGKRSGAKTREVVHARGSLMFNENQTPVKAERLDIQSITKRCDTTISGAACYTRLSEMGLQYGSRFRTIEKLFFNTNEVLAVLTLPAALGKDFSGYTLHPALMDGALQTVMGIVDRLLDQGFNYTALPAGAASVDLVRPLEKDCCIYARRTETSGSVVDGESGFMIDICSREGDVLVSVKDFVVKLAQMEAIDQQESAALQESRAPEPGFSLAAVELELLGIVSGILKMDPEKMDRTKSIESFGIDSIMMMSIIRRVNKRWSIEVAPAELIDYTTIESITAYLYENYLCDSQEPVAAPVTEKKEHEADNHRAGHVPARGLTEEMVREETLSIIAGILKMEPGKINTSKPVESFGIDSIMMMSIIRRINKRWSIEVAPAELIDYTTVESITGYIFENYLEEDRPEAGVQGSGEGDDASAPLSTGKTPEKETAAVGVDVDAMSEEDLDAILARSVMGENEYLKVIESRAQRKQAPKAVSPAGEKKKNKPKTVDKRIIIPEFMSEEDVALYAERLSERELDTLLREKYN
ncbi:MAG: SDR family NAD(P)-dependent oxidoreductase [bacterium]|nr:SDR family NAD(P)-dependent oxidoreductase [bacterium]